VRRFEGHSDLVGSVVFRLAQRIISVGDRTERVWDTDTGQQLRCSPPLPSSARHADFVDLDGVPHILIGTETDGLQLWRVPKEAGLMAQSGTSPRRKTWYTIFLTEFAAFPTYHPSG